MNFNLINYSLDINSENESIFDKFYFNHIIRNTLFLKVNSAFKTGCQPNQFYVQRMLNVGLDEYMFMEILTTR